MNGIITSNAMHGQVGTAINNEINNSHNTVIVGLKTVYDLMGTEFLQTISDFQGSVGETSETAILNEDTLNATKTKITNAGTSQTEYETSFNQVYDSINDLISLSSPSSIVSTYLSSTSKILQEVIDKVNSFENTATEIKVDNMLQVLSQQTEVGKQAQDLSYIDPQFVEFASYSQLSEKVQEIDKELTEAKEKAKKEAEEAEKKAREEWKRNHPVTAWLQDTSANIGAWWEGVKQGTKDIDIPFVRDTLLFAEGFIGQAGSTLSSVSIMASEFIELVPELGIVLASRIIGFEAPEWVEKDVSGTLDNAYSAGKYMYRFFTDGETRDQAWESLKKSAGDAWDKFWEDPAYNAGGATFEVASFFFGIGEAKAALTAAKGAETFLEGAKLFLKAAKNEAVQNGDNFIRNLKRLYHKKDDLARILAEGGSNSLDNLLRMRDNIGEFLSKHPLASMFGEEFSFAGVGRYFGGHYGDDFGRHTARVYNMADEVERGASRVSSKFSSEAFEGGVETGKGLADDIILRDGSHFDDFGNLKPNVRYQAGEFARSLDGSVDEVVEAGSKVGKDVADELVESSFDGNLIKEYVKDIKLNTNRDIPNNQIEELKNALRMKEYKKLSPVEVAKHRAEFNRVKNSLIDEWELKTGQTWPTYSEDVIGKNGNVVRKAGFKYDAHHIIENSYGGNNEWWNIHPARFPNEHQAGIHRVGSPARDLFK